MSKFQLILLMVFGGAILVAVLLFSTSRGSNNQTARVVVWGSIPAYDFNTFLNNAGLVSNKAIAFEYAEKPAESFNTEFTEALAEGKGPDLVIIPVSKLWKNKNKLAVLSPANVSPQDFADTFIEEGELFRTAEGVYALPLSVDPLVLYWNRDMFNNATLTLPPLFWDQMYAYAEKLSTKDNAGNLRTSTIALGEAQNIPQAKNILSLLLLQAGTPITMVENGLLRPKLVDSFGLPLVPGHAALDFYTQFSNPAKPFYSWNRSLLSAPTAFTSGTLAMYVGYASELRLLKAKNPTLNLGVTRVPQSRVSGNSITFGNLEGVAVVKSTKNPAAALQAAFLLVSKDAERAMSVARGVPPARRDLLGEKPEDPTLSVFYDSAIQAKGWIDPDDSKSARIFSDMIESVTSGRARLLKQ
jgi:ABC-type glycerol-3-phosphate transport system substrate-binding protein